MSYQALYRKYRPKNFDEVIGQEHITTTLKNQIKSGRVGHAYLFCGIRGTGKTSIAKIFAKAVNCPNNKDGNPCLECDTCKDISTNANINVIEIDAASNNGVDNVREIREDVKYMPTKGKYKVYIIDEVHMLSTSAFNALLKTLEEPPAHVIFILATTEVQKIPATILSRCQRFDLKRISVKKITSILMENIKNEGIDIEDKAVSYIASRSDGSVRDSQSLLDQIIAFSQNEKITLKMVLEILGAVDYEQYIKLIRYISEGRASDCIALINDLYLNGKDIKHFVSHVIEFLRNLIIVSSIHEASDILEISDENIEQLKQLSQLVDYNKVLEYISEFSSLEAKIKYDDQPKITLEIMLLKMCTLEVGSRKSEVRIAEIVPNKELKEDSKSVKKDKEIKKEVEVELPVCVQEEKLQSNEIAKVNAKSAMSDDMKQAIKMWNDIREVCKYPLKGMLIDAEAKFYDNKHYCIVCPDNIIKNYIDKNIDVIKQSIVGMLKKEFSIKLMTKEEYEKEVISEKWDVKEKKEDNDLQHVEDLFNKFGLQVEKMD